MTNYNKKYVKIWIIFILIKTIHGVCAYQKKKLNVFDLRSYIIYAMTVWLPCFKKLFILTFFWFNFNNLKNVSTHSNPLFAKPFLDHITSLVRSMDLKILIFQNWVKIFSISSNILDNIVYVRLFPVNTNITLYIQIQFVCFIYNCLEMCKKTCLNNFFFMQNKIFRGV